MRRTMLFLPGNNPNMIGNGGLLGADSLIFDLEDAVSPDEKDAARELLKNALMSLNFGKCERIIRINGLDTPYWEEDLRALLPLGPEVILPPKVSGADYIQKLDEKLTALEQEFGLQGGRTKIIALLETAMGIENAYDIAVASPRVIALFLGAEDLSADFRCARTVEGEEIRYARGRIVCAARAAGIEAYDTPFTDVRDLEALERDAAFAKGLGFTGKACISPAHVATVNRIFSPTLKEIDYAREVFDAIAQAKRQGKGAISLHGKMIDAPIVQRARLVLEAASEIKGVDYFG
ncbi:HpcH/HpaI aldolase/citrate lyase family protein [Oscillospiraceae bacterium LTW-04]|nr:aldolase/citrate lyase family protein [Oscillospiraceae bacterium MB24-C1]